MFLHRAAMPCIMAFVLGCVDAPEPLGIQLSTTPVLHLPISGVSVLTSGYGTATIDGHFTANEWDNAGSVNFAANLPPSEGGTSTPATLLALNDATNLYLALKIARGSIGAATNAVFLFDNDHSGSSAPSVGDDGFGAAIGAFGPLYFYDIHYGDQYPCPVGSLCTFSDLGSGGTNDGAVAFSSDGTFTFVELAHPLNSADDSRDFSLQPGAVVGFQMSLELVALPPCAFCSATTDLPTSDNYHQHQFADLQLAVLALPVDIDVKPGSEASPINLKSNGTTPVAILSTATFDATTIDPATVDFAGAPVAQRPNGSWMAAPADVNGDGLADLVVHVVTTEIQLDVGLMEAVLTGATFGGQQVTGSDWVKIVH